MPKSITWFSRIAVGVLFLFSGFIKLNDPIGFAYKLEEYFAPNVLNLYALLPYTLFIALFLVVAEILLGALLLLGYKRRFTLWALSLLILFFSFLTFYSAYFHKVTGCGCFGDAIALTPWESFGKDLVLALFIALLWVGRRDIRPFLNRFSNRWVLFSCFVLCLAIAYRVLIHLPLLDFRPYAVGENIHEQMVFPEGALRDVYREIWFYRVDGVVKAFQTEDAPWKRPGAEFINRKTELIQKGYTPPIHDLSAEREGVDHLSDLLAQPKILWVVIPSIDQAAREAFPRIKTLAVALSDAGIPSVALTASSGDQIKALKDRFSLPLDFYTCDQTTLKTMIRANPGLLLLQKGEILGKWSWQDTPDLREILAKFGL